MINAVTGRNVFFYESFMTELKNANEVKIIVSFLRESGVQLVIKDLKKQVMKGTDIKILTSDYLNITEPSALYLLKNQLGNMIDLRLYKTDKIAFHPKAYFFKKVNEKILFVGSSNFSYSAFKSGVEWEYRLVKKNDPEAYEEFENNFDTLFYEQAIKVDEKVLRQYASGWKKPKILKKVDRKKEEKTGKKEKPEPRGAQIEALHELNLAREEGVEKGMVAAATGIGKTYLAAFDTDNFNRVLFVAHREEILKQAKDSFKNIYPEKSYSFFNGEEKDNSGNVVFASIQTLRNENYLQKYFNQNFFDYIIVDEFHHAAADSYLNVIKYFEPEFLLGLTATPYRMDNRDIFELCNDNLIYEIDLKDAINRDLLVPFKYYGIYDSETDYEKIDFRNGKYNKKELEEALSTHKRADLIYRNYSNIAGERTLGFCASIEHAKYMAKYFNEKGINSVCVHSSSDKGPHFMYRDKAISKLKNKEIDVIFAVDIFNEGVDIPSLDTVLFLRPTESYVIFLQQLGRGLRKFPGKVHLKVLDFIGNYKRAHYLPLLLSGKNPMEVNKRKYKNIDEFEYPEDCQVNFDLKIIDLFKELRKNDPLRQRMIDEFYRLKEEMNRRPLRKDLYEGSDIDINKYLKRTHQGRKGYLRFLNSIDELTEKEEGWLDTIAEDFLYELEKTSMTKSYKMPTLLSLLQKGK
ncbi:MAG: DEAD/DEAH box helicase family protein, partial [Bacillota bacterium]